MILSIFGLIVGVSNDACNFLNSSLGSKVAPRHVIISVAAVGVVLGASFSSGMMEVARSGVFDPSMFNFHQVMILFLAVMITNVILLDIFNTLGLPTSTTVALVFALLGSALGVAYYNLDIMPSERMLDDYINFESAGSIIVGIFASVGIAFVSGSIIMWFTRLLFSFRYAQAYKKIGPLWCAFAFTAISYFAIFKGLKDSSLIDADTMQLLDQNQELMLLGAFIAWIFIAYLLENICKINTLKLTVLAGTGSLALAFAGNDLVNFIGVFMAAQNSMELTEQFISAGGNIDNMMMEGLLVPVEANVYYLVGAGLVMVLVLFFSKKARRVTDTEIKLAKSGAAKERFGSCQAARVIVRYSLKTKKALEKIAPDSVNRLVTNRFNALSAAERGDSSFDLIRASVNLTVAAILISIATSFKLPLSTTYVTFMVAMGSSLSDQAWGRESAVYRITGVLTVIGGWLVTALAAGLAAFVIALIMSYGGYAGIVAMIIFAGAILIKSTFFAYTQKEEDRILELDKQAAVIDFGINSADRLVRMIELNSSCINALEQEDLSSLRSLKKKARKLHKKLVDIRENEIEPTLQFLPRELADRGQLVFHISELSLQACEKLQVIIKTAHLHIDNNHVAISESQSHELLDHVQLLSRFYPSIVDMLNREDFSELKEKMASAEELRGDFSERMTRHLTLSQDDLSCARNNLLFLTLLNETRGFVSISNNLIACISELHEN